MNVPLRHSRSGFTMLEMMIVVVIIGLLSATAMPALSLMRDARQIGAAQEIERMLLLARAHAMAEGKPYGVSVGADTFQLLTIDAPGDAPLPAIGLDGEPRSQVNYAADLKDGVVSSFTSGSNGSGSFTAWFAIDGTPELRDSNGNRTGPWTSDMTIEVANTHVITVRRITGAIQRQ